MLLGTCTTYIKNNNVIALFTHVLIVLKKYTDVSTLFIGTYLYIQSYMVILFKTFNVRLRTTLYNLNDFTKINKTKNFEKYKNLKIISLSRHTRV